VKVTVRINEFKRVLEEALRVVPERATIPSLSCVKVDVGSDNLATISASDLDISIVQTFEVVEGDRGSFLLHAKQAIDFLKRHVGGTATIDIEQTGPHEKHAIVKAKAFTVKIPTMDVLFFPRVEEMMPQVTQAVSMKFLKRVIARVESACPTKAGRQSIPSIQLESDGKKLRAVATDCFRIAVAYALGDCGVFTALLPKSFLPVLTRRAGSVVRFAEAETNYFFQTDTVLLTVRKPTNKFPSYQKALNLAAFKGTVRVASAELKNAITNVRVGRERYDPGLHIAVRPNRLELTTTTATGSLKVFSEGEPDFGIKVNLDFVLDLLKQAEGEAVIQFIDDRSPVKFANGDNFQYFIWPMMREPDKATVGRQNPDSQSSENVSPQLISGAICCGVAPN